MILDVCCGARMFWYDKHPKDVVFCDNREISTILCDGRTLEVKPDIIADFTNLPFQDGQFEMVVFDPPHLRKAGEKSWLRAKYGVIPDNQDPATYIAQGFAECMRVSSGFVVFKWNEEQISFSEITKKFKTKPLFGDRRGKTRWCIYRTNNRDCKGN